MLTDEQKKRYSRQIALAEIGQQGQSALLEASVLVIGAGGLGAPVLQTLVGAGVGRIGIVDYDRVDLSNLHRQFIYQESDVGRLKVEAAVYRLSQLNSSVTLESYCIKVDSQALSSLIAGYDLVIDGCDNFKTRFCVNQECVEQKKPLISGAVSEWHGQVALFTGYEKNQPCYQCFCPAAPPASARQDCSMSGVTGALTAIIGAKMGMEAIRHIAQIGESASGKLMRYDALKGRFVVSHIRSDITCHICS